MLSTAKWLELSRKHGWKDTGNGNFRTPVARLSFAELFVAKPFQGGGDNEKSTPRFGTTVLLPKGDDAKLFVDALRSVLRQQFGDKATIGAPTGGAKPTVRVDYVEGGSAKRANVAWPVVDQGEMVYDGYEAGCLFVSAYSQDKPLVVDASRAAVNDPTAVYSGAFAFVTLRPYWSKSWNRLCIGLQGVQKLADGERFGGCAPSAQEQFEDVASDFAGVAAEGSADLADLLA